MKKTKIEWTQSTWNPVTGCTKISAGCKNCYAERMAKRLCLMGQPHYRNGFEVTFHEHSLKLPLSWKKPQTIFVNSMSDLFHEDIPLEIIQKIFKVMKEASWHTFQVLTKRADRLRELHHQLDWGPNIWMGVSVEDQQNRKRIDALREVPAAVRFLSCEPLIEDLQELDLSGIHWLITGGESGPRSRVIEAEWVRNIRDQAQEQNVAFFFKQWGGTNKKKAGKVLDGRIWCEVPERVLT